MEKKMLLLLLLSSAAPMTLWCPGGDFMDNGDDDDDTFHDAEGAPKTPEELLQERQTALTNIQRQIKLQPIDPQTGVILKNIIQAASLEPIVMPGSKSPVIINSVAQKTRLEKNVSNLLAMGKAFTDLKEVSSSNIDTIDSHLKSWKMAIDQLQEIVSSTMIEDDLEPGTNIQKVKSFLDDQTTLYESVVKQIINLNVKNIPSTLESLDISQLVKNGVFGDDTGKTIKTTLQTLSMLSTDNLKVLIAIGQVKKALTTVAEKCLKTLQELDPFDEDFQDESASVQKQLGILQDVKEQYPSTTLTKFNQLITGVFAPISDSVISSFDRAQNILQIPDSSDVQALSGYSAKVVEDLLKLKSPTDADIVTINTIKRQFDEAYRLTDGEGIKKALTETSKNFNTAFERLEKIFKSSAYKKFAAIKQTPTQKANTNTVYAMSEFSPEVAPQILVNVREHMQTVMGKKYSPFRRLLIKIAKILRMTKRGLAQADKSAFSGFSDLVKQTRDFATNRLASLQDKQTALSLLESQQEAYNTFPPLMKDAATTKLLKNAISQVKTLLAGQQ